MFLCCCLLSLASLSWVGTAVGYDLLREYSGQTFFDGWDFYGSWDNLTLGLCCVSFKLSASIDGWTGNATWVTQENATSLGLAYINEAGNAIMKVDNTTNVAVGEMRNSVRITSQDFYDYGSVWIIDLLHIPYGCSVWPAFWSKGPLWPNDGEIDIIEAINLMGNNQMALHTTEGCYHAPPPDQTGYNVGLDCGTGSGCVVGVSQPNSYESGFAAAGGGVYATQFDVSGIYMWFWSRPDVPESISQANSTLNISTWGSPVASYPTSAACNTSEYFTAQQLIFDITLCGDWAGVPSIYANTGCWNAGPTGDCYLDNVVGPGSPKYDEAYFEVSYVRTYTTGTVASVSSPTSTAASQTDPLPESTQRNASGGSRTGVRMGCAVLLAVLVACALVW
ncbi:concanavalin A-like lectin/glucanase domain-containing protein [Amylocystis lapponica]|nr:concanavalin A-like lectin/glucanase domain-containing protein [Amylocystis lapponica]